jgi:hypothetical protein
LIKAQGINEILIVKEMIIKIQFLRNLIPLGILVRKKLIKKNHKKLVNKARVLNSRTIVFIKVKKVKKVKIKRNQGKNQKIKAKNKIYIFLLE